jgi:protein TonB
MQALSNWLERNKTYPEAARRYGDEGRASVRFTVDRDGKVRGVVLLRGTGSTVLDEAVQELLRSARVPAFPPTMAQPEVTVSVSIRYTLGDSAAR